MASPNISFETIPSSIRVPGVYTEFNTKLAVRNLPVNPQKLIILAQTLTPITDINRGARQIFSDAEAEELYGAGSQAHLLVRQAIRNNEYMHLSVLGIADAQAGIAATGSVKIAGTATKQGVLTIIIAGVKYQSRVNKGDTPSTAASAAVAAINASPDAPIIAVNKSSTITLTAKNKGTAGNEITLSAAITAQDSSVSVKQMASGDVNPDISDALAEIAGEHYHIISMPYSDIDNANRLAEHIEHVSNSIEQRGCIGVLGHRGSMATGTTLTEQLNNGRLVVAWLKGALQTNGFLAVSVAAQLAFEEDPARPLNGLVLKGIDAPAINDRPTFAEFNSAMYNGLAPLEVVNNKVAIMRAITTYTKNSTGTDDPSLLDVTTIRTLDYARMAINQRINLRFPREKLSDKTPRRVRSEILDVLLKMEELEIVEQVQQNAKKLIVERDLQDVNRLNTAIPCDVVNGLHVVANRIDLYL
ncbi:MAG: phage tail sheath subtilisin-like domain-containing protein [Gammaproteobacteria bacterium]|nr:phage tail sheath subtilisin-like domain-containing protein [Gammaproteobacteria bacterium]